MTSRPEIVLAAAMPTGTARVYKRVRKACEGALLTDIAGALLKQYSETLMAGRGSYEQHRRNIECAFEVLDANARAYFKVNN